MQYVISDEYVQFGKRKYIGQYELDDVLNGSQFNKKTLIYPNGTRTVWCNRWIFRLGKAHKPPISDEMHARWLRFIRMSIPKNESSWDKKRENNMRAVKIIKDIVLLNSDLKYFVTLTFDPQKVDSLDPAAVEQKLTSWLKNNVQRKDLKYVLTSEYHESSNRIHFHGMINDVLDFVDSGTRKVAGYSKPVKLTKINRWLREGRITEDCIQSVVYNLPDWKYGFSTVFELEKSELNVAAYITKYISKDIQGKNKIFGKRYWTSRNLEVYPPVRLENVMEFDDLPYQIYDAPFGGNMYKYCNKMGDIVE